MGGGNPHLGNLFKQLGFEADKMLAAAASIPPFALSSLQNVFNGAMKAGAGAGNSLGGARGPMPDFGPLFAKIAYIAVLKAAIEKAGHANNFNVETAINDLWTHLDSVRRIDSPAPGGASMPLEKLKMSMQKNAALFDSMSQIVKNLKGGR
jgi:hypothetical protein